MPPRSHSTASPSRPPGAPRTPRSRSIRPKEQATFTVPRGSPPALPNRHQYRGILNDQLRGLYLSKANNRRYAVTQLEATDARRMFPSFDEPAFKATFALTATIDDGDHAISNGAILSDTPGPGAGKHTLKFDDDAEDVDLSRRAGRRRLRVQSGAADGIPIRVCSTPDKKA